MIHQVLEKYNLRMEDLADYIGTNRVVISRKAGDFSSFRGQQLIDFGNLSQLRIECDLLNKNESSEDLIPNETAAWRSKKRTQFYKLQEQIWKLEKKRNAMADAYSRANKAHEYLCYCEKHPENFSKNQLLWLTNMRTRQLKIIRMNHPNEQWEIDRRIAQLKSEYVWMKGHGELLGLK